MSSMWGNHCKLSIFGESHGKGIGVVLDGLPAGIEIDQEEIRRQMERRAPGRDAYSTSRAEPDRAEILSGLFEGRTTGAPLCAVIRNVNTQSKDYTAFSGLMRPGHADYPAQVRFGGFQDFRGGGHFSGRITAPIVFSGAVLRQILRREGIAIGAHLRSLYDVQDTPFEGLELGQPLFDEIAARELPFVDPANIAPAAQRILEAKGDCDSVGGVVECAVTGMPVGIGSPFFDSVESVLSHLLFSIPGVKGVEFGDGFALSTLHGSQSNDSYYYDGEQVKTKTNHNGGVLGGLTTGMPVILRVAVKPTASIAKEQDTVDILHGTNAKLRVKGRHDPCIAPRAVPVVEAMVAIGLYDLLREGLPCNY